MFHMALTRVTIQACLYFRRIQEMVIKTCPKCSQTVDALKRIYDSGAAALASALYLATMSCFSVDRFCFRDLFIFLRNFRSTYKEINHYSGIKS